MRTIAHGFYTWNRISFAFFCFFRGYDFRPAFLNTVQLRSIFPCPCLGLSGTVNTKVLSDIKDVLKLQDGQFKLVSMLPDRSNIYLQVVHEKSYNIEKDLLWVVEGLVAEGDKYPKTLLFAQSIQQVATIYEFVKTSLGPKAYGAEGKLISMYHGDIGRSLQEYILKTFCQQDSSIRVLVCTIAFGMGVEIPDIRQVIHWGKSKTLLGHWQEIGRAGRDGQTAKAIWYPKSTAGEDKETFDKIKKEERMCIRQIILEHFILPGMTVNFPQRLPCNDKCRQCSCQLCVCCSHCQKSCPCAPYTV